MERAAVAPWVADWVLGHERPGEGHGRYSEGPSDAQLVEVVKAVTRPEFKTLAAAISKVQYRGLKL